MLPSMGNLLMMVNTDMYMFDIDVGEIFYNFWLSSVMAKYCGVYLGSYLRYKKDRQGTPLCMRCFHMLSFRACYGKVR